MRSKAVLKLINFWPPFLGAGIKVKIADDFKSVESSMKLNFFNKNYVTTHFGGSLYAMTDPFFMLILMENIGRDYIVWDKAARIEFKKPGKGRVKAHFEIAADEIARIKKEADENYKVEPEFVVNVVDEDGDVVAEVHKTLYVRRKDRTKEPKP